MLRRIRIETLGIAAAFFGLALFGCDDADKCKTVPECKKEGKCSPDENGLCVVKSSEDCKGLRGVQEARQVQRKGGCVHRGPGLGLQGV